MRGFDEWWTSDYEEEIPSIDEELEELREYLDWLICHDEVAPSE